MRIRRVASGQSAAIENMILIGITIVLGAAVWSFVNSSASSAIAGYSERSAADINQVREKFVIVQVSFNYPNPNKVTVWLYNNGAVPTQITNVLFGTSETSLSSVPFSPSPLSLPKAGLSTLTFDSSITAGTTYFVKVMGKFGSIAITFQKG